MFQFRKYTKISNYLKCGISTSTAATALNVSISTAVTSLDVSEKVVMS